MDVSDRLVVHLSSEHVELQQNIVVFVTDAAELVWLDVLVSQAALVGTATGAA